MTLTVKHLVQLQEKLQDYHIDFQMEDVYSSEISARLIWLIMN